MGIINATPDSFSGDGVYAQDAGGDAIAAAVRRVQRSGARIVDVGGESTRPGHTPISAALEIERIGPVLERLRPSCPDLIVSVDTSRTQVAEFAAANGATIVNDVTGFRRDPSLLGFVADSGLAIVLTSSAIELAEPVRNHLGGGFRGERYGNVVDETLRELEGLCQMASAAGIKDEQIIVDPGVGMGKSTAQSIELTAHLDAVVGLGFPVLYGPSRKRFIGEVSGVVDPVQRVFGTAAAVVCAVAAGVAIVRVHDAVEMSQVVKVANALSGRVPT